MDKKKENTPFVPRRPVLLDHRRLLRERRKIPITLSSRKKKKNVTCLLLSFPPCSSSPSLFLNIYSSGHRQLRLNSLQSHYIRAYLLIFAEVHPRTRGYHRTPVRDFIRTCHTRTHKYMYACERARVRTGTKKCVRTQAQVYVYISRMFPLKNEPVPVPHGRNTVRKVSGVTGSIGGLLSINNVIIGC